jgi:hypothetical protein
MATHGPVRILCDEIGFPFDPRLEREDVFLAFVGELIEEVAQAHRMAVDIQPFTGKPASAHAGEMVAVARSMVARDLGLSREAREKVARSICDRAHEVNPDDPGHKCDHLVDMLASCAAAVWFGLQWPCRSRHAAEAAQHVWAQVYGVSRFDDHTPAWKKEWARSKLQSAIISLLPARLRAPSPTPEEQHSKKEGADA